MTDQEIGLFLEQTRIRFGMSKLEVATQAKVHLSLIGRYENGDRQLPRNIIPRIAKAYKVPLYKLLSLIYGGGMADIEVVDAVPYFKRIIESGITPFSLVDLYELFELEQTLGFQMSVDQLQAWFKKRSATPK